MNIKYNFSNKNLLIYLYGELDECSAVNARDAIDKLINSDKCYENVVFNLTNLTFMDSTGIGMMIGRYKKIKNKNRSVYIQNPSNTIEKILQLSGLYQIMPKI